MMKIKENLTGKLIYPTLQLDTGNTSSKLLLTWIAANAEMEGRSYLSLTNTALGNACELHPRSIARLLPQLEKKGLIERSGAASGHTSIINHKGPSMPSPDFNASMLCSAFNARTGLASRNLLLIYIASQNALHPLQSSARTGLTISFEALGEVMHLNRNSVARLANHLEQHGFIKIKRSTHPESTPYRCLAGPNTYFTIT